MSQELERVRAAWSAPESGTHYAGERWRRRGHAQRDPRRIEALLGRFPARATGRVLDAPCGTGRLQACLTGEGEYVGLDLSPSMLAASERGARCLGEVERLPFADQAFELGGWSLPVSGGAAAGSAAAAEAQRQFDSG